MKKLFLMVLMVFFTTTATFAQVRKGSITVQPKVGFNIANVTSGDGTDARIGLAVGAEFEFGLSDIFSLSAGALYSMQGCKGAVEIADGGYTVDADAKLDYINIPILANVYVAKGLAVKCGIQPGFNVKHKAGAEVSGVKVTTDFPGIRSVDFSIPVGLSYQINNFVADARYNLGLTSLLDGDDSKNSVFQVTFGYKFAL